LWTNRRGNKKPLSPIPNRFAVILEEKSQASFAKPRFTNKIKGYRMDTIFNIKL